MQTSADVIAQTDHIVDRPEWLPERPRGNPVALTDATPIRVTVADAQFASTLGLLFAENTDDPTFDRAGIFAALAKGEAYSGGGGAQPEWTVERVS